jgi:site-specific recombinase XerD
MTTAITAQTTALDPGQFRPVVQLVTDAVSSDHTRRAYDRALSDFLSWVDDVRPAGFTKATVQTYVQRLRTDGVPDSSVNQRLTAIRKLATEAADNGLITEQTAQAIRRVEGVRVEGRRLGNWLTLDQAQALIRLPDTTTRQGLRDRAILAVLDQLQQREGRWVVVDLVGKRNKTRSVPMPSWAKAAVDDWTSAASVDGGVIFRQVRKGDHVQADPITSQAVWLVVKRYADQLGADIAPHDLRRTYAKLARKGGSPLDQIQLSLGHASVETTQRYIGDNQDLTSAPCDVLGLKL